MKSFTMAWRNVWRNSRRTWAVLAATTLGLWVMIVYSGLAAGMFAGLESNLLDLEMGDAQIFHPDYQSSHSLHDAVEDPERVLSELDDAGYAAAPRLLGSGLAAHDDASAGIQIIGVDVGRDAKVTVVSERVGKGKWLDDGESHEVVIGRKLALMLGIGLGDDFVVLTQGADGSNANDLYTVRGILGPVGEGVDRGGVFMTEAAFRELFVFPEGVHKIIVRRGERTLAQTGAEAKEASGDAEAKTWRELNPTLAQMLDSSEGSLLLMMVIVYIAIAIVILNAMLMAVFERIKEFGVLKAIGVGPGGVMKLILFETIIITGVAIAIGVALAVPTNWYMATHGLDLSATMGHVDLMGLAFDPVWRSKLSPEIYTRPIGTLVVIVMIAVIYPALRAAFIQPITAMRSH